MTLEELTINHDAQRVPVKETERKSGIYPYYGASGIVDHVDRYILDGEYLLIAEDGENLRTQKTPIAFLARGKFWVNNHAHVVTANAHADTRFLMYALNNGDISGFLTGSTMPKLTQGNMNRIPILTPPLPEQRAIASVLGALDDKIELNRRMNETLEALAQTLFKSWFVDATANGLPKGWREAPLPELIEVNPPRRLRTGEVAPYLDMANMPTRSARALEVYAREFGAGMRFADGDTLVARITPCLENGKTCFVDFLGEGKIGWGSTEYIVLHPAPPLSAEFAYFLARTDEFRGFAISNMTGTSGRQRVPADCLNDFTVAVPPAELAQRFGQSAKAVFAKMKGNDAEARTLAGLRDALLPKLLSGELRVPASLGTQEAKT